MVRVDTELMVSESNNCAAVYRSSCEAAIVAECDESRSSAASSSAELARSAERNASLCRGAVGHVRVCGYVLMLKRVSCLLCSCLMRACMRMCMRMCGTCMWHACAQPLAEFGGS